MSKKSYNFNTNRISTRNISFGDTQITNKKGFLEDGNQARKRLSWVINPKKQKLAKKKKKDTKALEPPGTHTSTGKNVNQNRNTEIINKRGGKKSGKIFSFTK